MTKKGMNPVVAGAIGVAVGAAAAVAVEELAKEENRVKIGEEFEKVKDQVEEYVATAGKKVEDIKKGTH